MRTYWLLITPDSSSIRHHHCHSADNPLEERVYLYGLRKEHDEFGATDRRAYCWTASIDPDTIVMNCVTLLDMRVSQSVLPWHGRRGQIGRTASHPDNLRDSATANAKANDAAVSSVTLVVRRSKRRAPTQSSPLSNRAGSVGSLGISLTAVRRRPVEKDQCQVVTGRTSHRHDGPPPLGPHRSYVPQSRRRNCSAEWPSCGRFRLCH